MMMHDREIVRLFCEAAGVDIGHVRRLTLTMEVEVVVTTGPDSSDVRDVLRYFAITPRGGDSVEMVSFGQ
jgi:hypothetical protein